jgi:hypothetical protein
LKDRIHLVPPIQLPKQEGTAPEGQDVGAGPPDRALLIRAEVPPAWNQHDMHSSFEAYAFALAIPSSLAAASAAADLAPGFQRRAGLCGRRGWWWRMPRPGRWWISSASPRQQQGRGRGTVASASAGAPPRDTQPPKPLLVRQIHAARGLSECAGPPVATPRLLLFRSCALVAAQLRLHASN